MPYWKDNLLKERTYCHLLKQCNYWYIQNTQILKRLDCVAPPHTKANGVNSETFSQLFQSWILQRYSLCKVRSFLKGASGSGTAFLLGPTDLRVNKKKSVWKQLWGFPGSANGKEPACQCSKHKRCRFNPWVGKIPWRRAWQPTPVFLPGKSQGQRSLEGYSP